MEANRSEVDIIYRDNDLFRGAVPVVVDELEKLGYEVKSQVFCEGQDPAEIAAWVEANKADLKGKRVVVDGTVKAQGRGAFYFTPSLDGIMHDATLAAVLPGFTWNVGEDFINQNGDANYDLLKEPGAHKAVFLEIMRRIAENEKAPKRVLICLNRLAEHEPFRDHAKEKELSPDGAWWGSDQKKQYDAGKNQQAFEILKSWLAEAGIEEVEIYDGQDLNGSNDWILIDRHATHEVGFIKEKKRDNDREELVDNPDTPVMVLPAENFISSALKNGLLDGFHPEVVQMKLRESVRKLFAEVSV